MDSLTYDSEDLHIPEMDCPPSAADALFEERQTPAHDAPEEDSDDTPTSLCVAFRGINGGAGVTSLAIETAHAFAQARRGAVCLIDLDFSLGMCAHYLDIPIQPELTDFQTDPSRIDRNYVQAMLSHHEAGFAVLGSPGAMGGNDAVNPAAVLAIMDIIGEMFPVVILDVPRLTRPWTEAALLAADRVCLVSEKNIPALHVTRLRLQDMEAMGVQNTDVIMTKVEKRSFKASIRVGDAERALGQKVTAVIHFDDHTPAEAMNCGEPAGRINPGSVFAKDASALARALSPAMAERRRRRSLLGRLNRR